MTMFCVITLFPDMINSALSSGVAGRARDKGIIDVKCVDLRDFAVNKHGQVDDYPYGGGAGMVLMPKPVYEAFNAAKKLAGQDARVVYLTPQGAPYKQKKALELAEEKAIILLCGHYEGVDERVIEEICPEEISMGDFVLSGGEIAALAVIDSVTRLIPGALNNAVSALEESFSSDLLEYPHYTRPPDFMGRKAPEVLLSGHHENVEKWRREQSLSRTAAKRPDLFGGRL